MKYDNAMVGKLLRQQAAMAAFGTFALRQSDLQAVLDEAVRVCAEGILVPFAKICRYRVEEHDLIIEAGFGWHAGVVGHIVSSLDTSSPQGRAFVSGKPSISNLLREESAFVLPAFYAEHGIISTIDVVIKGEDQPYGVLEIDSDRQQEYDQHDVDFLTGFANVLGEAVATAKRIKVLHAAVERMQALVEEKDRLLEQRNVLAEELQHRVRNNLQLVYGMLSKQLDETTDVASQRGIRGIARRVLTLAQVYDQLLGSEITRTIDFCEYLKALCVNISDVHAPSDGSIRLECSSDTLLLDLDVITALGIIVAELVTNSFDHAFPTGKGQIRVSLSLDDGGDGHMATMIICDDGSGFVPDAESKRHGLGLVRRLSEQIGGSATIESDHGTIWTVRFPIADAVEAAPPPVSPAPRLH